MATVVITGCNRGIGLQLATQFKARGDEVIAVCRSASDELVELDVSTISGIDVSDDTGVSELARQLDGKPIDVLLNNAGILLGDSLASVDFEKMIEQFKVNTLGPLRVTQALLSNLSSGGKVAIVSSRVGSIEDNTSGGNYGYRVSKAGANMVGMNLHRDLAGRGIAVAILHPGLVATDMTGGTGITPTVSASGIIARIDELTAENSGTFWHAEGYVLPW